MKYVKVWFGEGDNDVREIVESIDRGERSAWIRDAIREKAGQDAASRGPQIAAVDVAPIVTELQKIATALSSVNIASIPASGAAETDEDPEAAQRLDGMFP